MAKPNASSLRSTRRPEACSNTRDGCAPQWAYILACLLLTTLASAAPPVLTSIFPAGGQRGSSFSATLGGAKGDTPAISLWIDCQGVLIAPGDKRSAQITIAPNAQLGLHLIRAFNDEGASELRWFSIGDLSEITETEPNDELGKEQPLTKLPLCLNAKLGKSGDTDLYSFDLAAGQTFHASVEAYALGIGVDTMLQLRGPAEGAAKGAPTAVLATTHDARNLDPQLTFTAKLAGKYSLQVAGFPYPPVADVRYFGGEEIIYRLRLSTGPVVTRVFPAAISRKAKTKLDLLGIGIPAKTASLDEPAGATRSAWPLIQSYTPANAFAPIQIAVTDHPITREAEPNSTADKAQAIAMPACLAGRIDKPDDTDRFKFSIKKGDYRNIRLLAKKLGLQLSARLAIADASGAELASSEAATEGTDPLLSWKAPADGDYQIIVSDLYRRGGEAAEYVLFFEPGEETFTASLSVTKSALAITAGQTTEIKLKATRVNGYKGPLVARVSGLPAGVFASEVPVPEKSGTEFSLTLSAAGDAMPGHSPIAVALWTQPPTSAPPPPAKPTVAPAKDKDGKPIAPAAAAPPAKAAAPQHRLATFPLRAAESTRGTTPLDDSSSLWLTVLPAK